jgi:high-affinity K+ transport system ATPase subunit B
MARSTVSAAVLFIFAAFVQGILVQSAFAQSIKAAEDASGNDLIILAQVGTISDGHCRCKDLCDVRQSTFSQGRTVAECKVKCQQAYSGCTRGEVRSKRRRD